MEVELAYYRRRAAEEAAAADSAGNEVVRNTHLELSRRYAERLAAIEADRQPPVKSLLHTL